MNKINQNNQNKNNHAKWFAAVVVFAVLLILFWYGGIQNGQQKTYSICCIGDSITYGTGVVERRDTDSYPAQLKELLGAQYEVYNYGVSGRTLLHDTAKPYKDTGYLEAAAEQKPDIIIVMLGSNDSKPQNWNAAAYREQYTALLHQLGEIGSNPKLYIAVPPEAFAGEDGKTAYCIDNDVIRDEIKPIVEEIAEQTGAELIDMYTATEGHPEYFMDGVHPNKEGNAALAQAAYEKIAQSWLR